MTQWARVTVIGTAVFLTACARPDKGPILASSAGQPTYALKYSEELAADVRAVGEVQDQEHKLATDFGARIDELKKPDWDFVRAVVDKSDSAGKSADFFETHSAAEKVRAFWADEKGPVDARVGGSSQHAVKQASCTSGCTELDVAGPAVFALNEAMEKGIVKRLRASNDAFILIEREHTTMGPQNAAVLEKLADDVSQASYLVHVDLVVRRDRIKRMVTDANEVKATLEHFVQDEKSYRAQAGRTESDKKASDERVTQAVKSEALVDSAVAQAQAALQGNEKAAAAATKDYDDALKSLRDKIDQKKKGRE
jgi:hypothetical protein